MPYLPEDDPRPLSSQRYQLAAFSVVLERVIKKIVGQEKGAPMITNRNQACSAKMSGSRFQEVR